MENKPIKRNKNLLQLSRDHHAGLLFCWKIRQGIKMQVATERLSRYVQYFWNEHMQPHFREEEEILFKPVDDQKVQKAFNDHQAIKNLVDQLVLQTGNNSIDTFATLANTLDAHIRYEERELFPHLEAISTEDQLASIGVQLSKHELQKDNYQDEFWLKE